jgi:3-oxosteroid 1-dehydrogenase
VDEDVSTPGVWSPASKHVERDGRTSLFPYGYLDRGKPGAIAIDENGKRFCNESNSYQDVVVAMFANSERAGPLEGHLVFDANFLWKYGAGIVPPHTRRPSRWVANGYLVSAGTIGALAGKLGVPPATLEGTVERYNRFARAGVDEDFHKGETIFNRFNGDPAQKPNPCLAPIEKAPFYALKIQPTTLAMSVGLRTNGDAQVLGASGQPIPGLYACGNEMGSVMRGYCPGAGATLGPALAFGYIAARHATRH